MSENACSVGVSYQHGDHAKGHGAPCTPLWDHAWTEPERWAWGRIASGRDVDFNERYGRGLDPRKEEEWVGEERERRTLSNRWLRMVLLSEPWRSAIPANGLKVNGALFAEDVVLADAEIQCLLGFISTRFARGISCSRLTCASVFGLDKTCIVGKLAMDGASAKGGVFLRNGQFTTARLVGVQTEGQIILTGAKFSGELAMDGASAKGGVFLRGGEFATARLVGVQTEGQISLAGARFSGELAMDWASAKGGVFLSNGEFATALLRGVQTEGQIILTGAKFSGQLAMDRASAKGDVFLDGGEFATARLPGVQAGGQISLTGAKFSGELAMDGASAKGSVFLDGGEFATASLMGVQTERQINLTGAKFSGALAMDFASAKGGVFLRNGEFATARLHGVQTEGQIILEGATFGQKLYLETAKADSVFLRQATFEGHIGAVDLCCEQSMQIDWQCALDIELGGAKVGVLFDDGSLPPEGADYRLEGFTYDHHRRYDDPDAPDRGAAWYINWLSHQTPFSPQPYEQAARVLRAGGRVGDANAVLYASRERERRECRRNGRKLRALWLLAERALIGYGLGWRLVAFPLAWVVALTLVGGLLYPWLGAKAPRASAPWWLGFSLDQVLPIVELSKAHAAAAEALHGVAKGYMFFSKLMGWVLAAFVVAGLTGVTKRS